MDWVPMAIERTNETIEFMQNASEMTINGCQVCTFVQATYGVNDNCDMPDGNKCPARESCLLFRDAIYSNDTVPTIVSALEEHLHRLQSIEGSDTPDITTNKMYNEVHI